MALEDLEVTFAALLSDAAAVKEEAVREAAAMRALCVTFYAILVLRGLISVLDLAAWYAFGVCPVVETPREATLCRFTVRVRFSSELSVRSRQSLRPVNH